MPAGAQAAEWDRVNHGVRVIIREYYWGNSSGDGVAPITCLADQGDLCFGGDPEDQFCTLVPECRSQEDESEFLRRLRAAAERRPADTYAMGQAVYAFMRLGRPIQAFQLADACTAVGWWCELLRGVVLHRTGQPNAAEVVFRQALERADPDLACRLRDIGPLIPGRDRRRYHREPCGSRDSLEAWFWWLTDPLFSVDGNDRYAEHVARRVETVLHEQIVETSQSLHPDSHEDQLVRRGSEDSWRRLPYYTRFTSRRRARYHFVPEMDSLFGAIDAVGYRLDAGDGDEGFTPASGPFVTVPAQFVRFRQGDSMLVAAATDLANSPAEDWSDPSVVLVLSDAPSSDPVVFGPMPGSTRVVFAAPVVAAPYVASLELTSAAGAAGRHRRGLPALPASGFGASDILLYEPTGGDPPGSRDEAIAAMLGTTDIEAGHPVGVYWEAYGIVEGEQITRRIEIEGERPGLLARIAQAIGLGQSETPWLVSWVAAGREDVYRAAFDIDIQVLEPATYTLRLVLETERSGTAEAVRSFRIVAENPP